MQPSGHDGATAIVVCTDGPASRDVSARVSDVRLAIPLPLGAVSPASLEHDECVPR